MTKGRFDYIAYDAIAQTKQIAAKILCTDLEALIVDDLPAGRAQSLALTKLEECYMWIGKAIRDEQTAQRNAILQEERNDE